MNAVPGQLSPSRPVRCGGLLMVDKPPDRRPPATRPPVPAKRAATTQGTMTRPTRIMVRTRWSDDDGVYRVSVEAPVEGVRVMLTHAQAWDHAQSVIIAAHRAAYDALMLNQFAGKFKVPVATVSNVIKEARKHRGPLPNVNTDPLRFDPGVDGKTGRGYIAVAVGVERITRWSVAEADAYARTVIGTIETAELDTATFTTLTLWGADEQRVRNSLAELHVPREF